MKKTEQTFEEFVSVAKHYLATTVSPAYQNVSENIQLYSPMFSHLEQAFFILDFRESKFVFLSENIGNLCGYPRDEMMRMGPMPYMELWHEKDFQIITNQVFTEGLSILKTLKDYDITKHKITYSYRIKQPNGTYKTLLNQFAHVLEDDERNPLMIMGTTSDFSHFQEKQQLYCHIQHQNNKGNWVTLFERYYSLEENPVEDYNLTPKEYEVIRFVHKGFSSKEIANRTNRSEETIRSQRKSILSKTGCQNMTEVIALAMKNNWL